MSKLFQRCEATIYTYTYIQNEGLINLESLQSHTMIQLCRLHGTIPFKSIMLLFKRQTHRSSIASPEVENPSFLKAHRYSKEIMALTTFCWHRRHSCTRREAWNSRPGSRGDQEFQGRVSEFLSDPVLRLTRQPQLVSYRMSQQHRWQTEPLLAVGAQQHAVGLTLVRKGAAAKNSSSATIAALASPSLGLSIPLYLLACSKSQLLKEQISWSWEDNLW